MTDYTNNNHPITPPLKLFREWTKYRGAECEDQFWWRIATQAARWGADQELEACCEWLSVPCPSYGRELRNARRPKPPSLKEQALEALRDLNIGLEDGHNAATIRRALESLPD